MAATGPAHRSQTAALASERRGKEAKVRAAIEAREDRFAAFENSRLQLIHKSLSMARYGGPALALIISFLFSIWIDVGRLAIWAIGFALIHHLTITFVGRMRADSRDAKTARRKLLYAGALLSTNNAALASVAVLFWVPDSISNHLLILTILASGVPYAMATASASLRAFSISVAPLAAVMLVRPLFEGTPLFFGIAGLETVYFAMMFLIARQLHRTVTSMLQIKENNADLLVQVAKAKAESDAARYRAERLNQAKSTFLANMSHELRTPLNAILGFSEVIHNEMLGPIGSRNYKDYAGDIHTSGRHLLGLINDILDLSRIEAGRVDLTPVVLSVREVIADTMRLTEGAAAKNGVTIVRKISDDLAHIRCDERAMRQILLNLMSNAVKFTPQGGRVTISAFNGSTVFGPHGLTLTIEDTGVGIKKEDMAIVLEAFGQVRVEDLAMTAPREQGTGLGLPIVRGLIDAHGGKFTLESEYGVGTRASVHLPRRCVLDPAQIDEAPEAIQVITAARRAR